MASRFVPSCWRFECNARAWCVRTAQAAIVAVLFETAPAAHSQFLIRPTPGEQVRLMPSDLAILDTGDLRKDLPCSVVERKPELGFDLRFHSGYEVSIPLRELSGAGEMLTVLFRVSADDEAGKPAYFVQHYEVPSIPDDARGDAILEGIVDLGEGKYHVDWLMRDRAERICSTVWEVEAALPAKDKPMPLFLGPSQVAESLAEPFANDAQLPAQPRSDDLELKLLVNFAPQKSLSAALQRSDTEALVSILKAIQRDPRVAHISLVAFNIDETRVIYRQNKAGRIDFPALGSALRTVKPGTVNLVNLSQPHSQTDFLERLIEQEVGSGGEHPDAVIFAGPKAMLNADVPQQDLRRIGEIECPVFYMNYNLNPQAAPWKDSISHAIRAFKGTEYTISRPRDLWFSTTEMFNRIMRSKRQRPVATTSTGGGN